MLELTLQQRYSYYIRVCTFMALGFEFNKALAIADGELI